LLGVCAEHPAQSPETGPQRRGGDVFVRPQDLRELAWRHDAVAVLQQVGEQPARLWLEGNRISPAKQVTAHPIELEFSETVPHGSLGIAERLRSDETRLEAGQDGSIRESSRLFRLVGSSG